ncbi:hypothetical protein AFLA70_73g004171 [Aspergillus flavus AF70]|nr:hypothetical protein AFLA70_73g004171 [Aspergillus flavus AF70]
MTEHSNTCLMSFQERRGDKHIHGGCERRSSPQGPTVLIFYILVYVHCPPDGYESDYELNSWFLEHISKFIFKRGTKPLSHCNDSDIFKPRKRYVQIVVYRIAVTTMKADFHHGIDSLY